MKVSLNIIKQYTNIDLSIDELVTNINRQLGKVETVTELGQRYAGAVIAQIVLCENHPDADRLHICRIDDGGVTPDVERGEDGLVQVVCGAPNARAGITVVWLPPGSTVPSSFDDAEPFVLGSRPLRGVVSHGMLASPLELGIGDNHDGILEINPAVDAPAGRADEVKPGAAFADIFELDDTVIELENKMFTHRPDCFGQLGVAREIAGIQHQAFVSPDWYLSRAVQDIYENFKDTDDYSPITDLPLTVRNDAGQQVPRLLALTVKDVTVRPSPLWLQATLVRLGSRPINNIVDLTNYVMLLTGLPLHAYDYDKVGSGQLTARLARAGESIALLNGKTISLDKTDIVITDGTRPIGLGGIMGGADTEVSDSTRNIILECANFDMYVVRKSSMRHGLFTDAVTRFNKGQSPGQNDVVANHAAALLLELTGGLFQAVYDTAYGRSGGGSSVDIGRGFIAQRLGIDLPADTIEKLLINVEFDMEPFGDGWITGVPFWRTDIELPEDIVEEIGRLYGYDMLPRELPQRSIRPVPQNPLFMLKNSLRQHIATLGANEVLTYSFVHENILKRAGQDAAKAYKLGNALSPDLQYYRLSLTPSLLDKVHGNIKAGYNRFALFELGKAHMAGATEPGSETLPEELEELSFVLAAKQPGPSAPYYDARQYLDRLLSDYGVAGMIRYRPLSAVRLDSNPWLEQIAAPYEPGRSAVLSDDQNRIWGIIGEYKPSVRKGFKLPDYTAGFELDPRLFLESAEGVGYTALPRFPKVRQDISLKVTANVGYQALYDVTAQALHSVERARVLSTLEPVTIYQSDKDQEYKTVTFRYSVASYDKTMTDAEVTAMLEQAAAATAEAVQAQKI